MKMSPTKNKVNFTKIRELIHQMDTIAGLLLFRNLSRKSDGKEKFIKATLPAQVVVDIFMCVSTLIVSNFNLISIIFVSSVSMTYCFLFVTLKKFIVNKTVLRGLVKWCESLYDVQEKFNKATHKTVETHLVSIEKLSFRMMKAQQLIIYINSFNITCGFALIGQILPENIYPKFSLPVPIYLPFKNQNTWTAFLSTVLAQTIMANHISIMSTYVLGVFYCTVIHVLGFLDIVQELVAKMNGEMRSKLKSFDDEVQSTSKSKPTLRLKDLASINKSLNSTTEDTSFEEWMKIITDMISDVNAVVTSLNNLFKEFFLMFEIANLGALSTLA